jgi:alpha-L-fucosidase 2
MTNFSFLVAVITTALMPCSPPVPLAASGNYILPGVLGDVLYNNSHTLDAYAPAGQARPAAVIIHGRDGNKRTHVTPLFELLDSVGYAWFSVDYDSESDVVDAIRFIRCPGRFNVSNDLTLIGEDTGAKIAFDLGAQGGFRGVVTFGAQFGADEQKHLPAGMRVLMVQGSGGPGAPFRVAEGKCREIPGCEFFPVSAESLHFEHWHPDRWEWKEAFTAWLRDDRRGLWKNITYSRPGGRPVLMDAFIPNGPGPFPAVIMVHGGGWETGDKVTSLSPLFEPLARAEFGWFSIDYRLAPYVQIPGELEDLRTAIRYVRAHSAQFHVDPNRIAILGESSGGHLVAQVASERCAGCEVQAVVSFYGVYDLTRLAQQSEWKDWVPHWFEKPSPEILREFSPIFHVAPELPPLLLIQGTQDRLYEGTLKYEAQLKKARARSKLIILQGAPHGMEDWEGHPEWVSYKDELVDWLSEVLNGQRVPSRERANGKERR